MFPLRASSASNGAWFTVPALGWLLFPDPRFVKLQDKQVLDRCGHATSTAGSDASMRRVFAAHAQPGRRSSTMNGGVLWI